MKLILDNQTEWQTRMLRPWVLRVARAEFDGTTPSRKDPGVLHVRIVYGRGRSSSCSGLAWRGTKSSRIRVPHPKHGVPFPVLDFCHVLAHEFAHNRGFSHEHTRKQGYGGSTGKRTEWMHKQWGHIALPVPLPKVAKTVPHAERVVARRTAKIAEAEQKVAEWGRKVKLAQTKVRVWKRKLAQRQKRLDAPVVAVVKPRAKREQPMVIGARAYEYADRYEFILGKGGMDEFVASVYDMCRFSDDPERKAMAEAIRMTASTVVVPKDREVLKVLAEEMRWVDKAQYFRVWEQVSVALRKILSSMETSCKVSSAGDQSGERPCEQSGSTSLSSGSGTSP